jgi:putative ABC transport system permease protein
MVTPGYFDVARVELVEGRLLTEADDHEAPGVVVLNRAAAQRYFPDGDALGQRIGFWGLGFREIVGIIADERVHGLRAAPPPAFYTNLLQTPPAGGDLTLMVRTEGQPLEWAGPVRAALAAVDPQLAVFDVTSMDATLARAQQRERFVASLIAVFALMAVVLASTGVYGVLSHFVARRRREMGIRLALGAEPRRLRRMILGQGLWIAGLGVVAGLVLARLGVSVLQGLLFGVEGGDVLPYAGAAALLLAVALLASDFPARRAATVAPADSLRTE